MGRISSSIRSSTVVPERNAMVLTAGGAFAAGFVWLERLRKACALADAASEDIKGAASAARVTLSFGGIMAGVNTGAEGNSATFSGSGIVAWPAEISSNIGLGDSFFAGGGALEALTTVPSSWTISVSSSTSD